jgi:hypothetical protein
MSLKKFLQQKGFLEKDGESEKDEPGKSANSDGKQESQAVEPTYFPLYNTETPGTKSMTQDSRPFVVSDSAAYNNVTENIDQAFIKFFEDELVKANFIGPDYFEFRKQMQAMYQKIGKGTSPHIILQAVLTSFEAQNISTSKLLETAKQYKDILEKKKIDFLRGAAAEKDKQLQKRQDALKTHQDNLNQMQSQLLQLQNQEKQLQDMIKREQTQMEVNKTLGKEGIEKIERAEKQISLAHNYMAAAIDADIVQLHSA